VEGNQGENDNGLLRIQVLMQIAVSPCNQINLLDLIKGWLLHSIPSKRVCLLSVRRFITKMLSGRGSRWRTHQVAFNYTQASVLTALKLRIIKDPADMLPTGIPWVEQAPGIVISRPSRLSVHSE